MKKIMITENFFLYQFDPEPERVLGQNIYVLFHEKECIVFDAGYERHMRLLKEELSDYKIRHIICTHFHPDHCFGLNELPKQHIIGSSLAQKTLSYFNEDKNQLFLPDIEVESDLEIKFFNHTIKLSQNKGHSDCGMLIDIDSKYLLTGDEFMTTNDNLKVIPYVAESISQHINALNRIISEFKGYTFLPAHGVITSDLDVFEFCRKYLVFALTKNPNLDEFYFDERKFLNESWHQLNIEKPE